MFESLKDSKDKLEAARVAAAAAFTSVVKDAFKEFFGAHPEIAGVQWEQYTPYFNDGDACVFRVRDWSAKPTDADKEAPSVEPDDDDQDEDGYIDEWTMERDPRTAGARADLATLFGLLDDDLMQGAFGDHAQVTATAAGFEVTEYEHD